MTGLRDVLAGVGGGYDRQASMSSPSQALLRKASEDLASYVPSGFLVKGLGGQGVPSIVPLIAIFDPDETTTAQRGTYLCYLFAADMSCVYLSLDQGVTELAREYGQKEARDRLAREAEAVRELLTDEFALSLLTSVDLRSDGFLPTNYQLGNVLAKYYDLRELPDEDALSSDLAGFVRLYQAALAARDDLRMTRREAISTSSARTPSPQRSAEFKPKNDDDYIQEIAQRTIVKSRKHETTVAQFGAYAESLGHQIATSVHPRDMTVLDSFGNE